MTHFIRYCVPNTEVASFLPEDAEIPVTRTETTEWVQNTDDFTRTMTHPIWCSTTYITTNTDHVSFEPNGMSGFRRIETGNLQAAILKEKFEKNAKMQDDYIP